MSVENFDGDGLADQPSIIYSFETDDADDIQIRELARSGFGSPDPSPYDVIERESTNPRLLFGCRDVVISGETTVVMIFQRSLALRTRGVVVRSTSGERVHRPSASVTGRLL